MGTGTLHVLNGGSVSNTNGYIARYNGSSGTATVEGDGSTWTNSVFHVGDSGTGTLNVLNGGSVSSTSGYIGFWSDGTGTATVDGAGSTWASSASLSVGYGGTGTLNVLRGGSVSNASGSLGYRVGGNGTATVDGAGSTWTSSGGISVGTYGTGTLYVCNSGLVSNLSLAYVGEVAGSRGEATVEGAGSTWTNSAELCVGNGGTGTLNVLNGGSVSNTWGCLGNLPGSRGTAMVDGAGSLWSSSGSLYVGGSDTAAGGSGSVSVSNGGEVRVGGSLRIWGTGSVALSGGTVSVESLVNDGTFAWTGGMLEYRDLAGLTLGLGGPFGAALTIPGGGTLQVPNGLAIQPGAALSASGPATVIGPVVNGGMVNGPGGGDWLAFPGDVRGAGNFTGNIEFLGSYSPGDSPAITSFEGNVLLGPTNQLIMELAGLAPGTGYDQVNILGDVTLGGELEVLVDRVFRDLIQPTDTFYLMSAGAVSGEFSNVAPGGRLQGEDLLSEFTVYYGPGSPYGAQFVVLGDFAAIPEPGTLTLLALGGLGLLRRRKGA